MQIVHYPHPTLRHRSKPLQRVDGELRRMAREMFGLMYAAKGIGLAANQVDLPYRLFVVNLASDPEAEEGELVFINPVLSQRKGSEEADEGCLSIPELYAPVNRPATVTVEAYGLDGERIRQPLEGMMARVVQHETDHLDGVLFTDRLSETHKTAVRSALEEFELEFQSRRRQGEIEPDEAIAARLEELERQRC